MELWVDDMISNHYSQLIVIIRHLTTPLDIVAISCGFIKGQLGMAYTYGLLADTENIESCVFANSQPGGKARKTVVTSR